MKKILLFLIIIPFSFCLANTDNINTQRMPIIEQQQSLKLAYRIALPDSQNNKHQAILLLHGGLGNSTTWLPLMHNLAKLGYTVIAPDQLGFGLSSKPIIQYSYQQMAENTYSLLTNLQIKHVIIIGHSMGGALASRFTLMFPQMVDKLILEDPLGLEDYRLKIPYQSIDALIQDNIKNHIDPTPRQAFIHALINDMIYTQPIVYELSYIKVPTLVIIGENDRTAPGKEYLSPQQQKELGNFPLLAQQAVNRIPNATLKVIPNVGHVPHQENFPSFFSIITSWLNS